jgi:D-aminopeptidase
MTSLRAHGLRIGELEPGPRNAITDVAGVRVGHVTVVRDEPDPPDGRGVARSGVTAIAPAAPDSLVREPLAAGTAVLNGAGELTGSLQIAEWGVIETPIYLTATMSVGCVYDGAVAAAVASDARVGVDTVVIPVVGECDDSWLNDARVVQVEAADAGRALAAASEEVQQGAVGAGTGMVCFDRKGGIGSARELRVDGVPVGRLLDPPPDTRSPSGSCIAVVATDAPLTTAQLARLARRAGLGLARTGSVAHHGSGEIFVAFSAARGADALADRELDPLFAATVDAAEEAVLNALWAAQTTTGREGRVAHALPHDDVLELLAAHGRLAG